MSKRTPRLVKPRPATAPPPEPPTLGEQAIETFHAIRGKLTPIETPDGMAFIDVGDISYISAALLTDSAHSRGAGRRPRVDPTSPTACYTRWVAMKGGAKLIIEDSPENLLRLGIGSSWPASDKPARPPALPLLSDETDGDEEED